MRDRDNLKIPIPGHEEDRLLAVRGGRQAASSNRGITRVSPLTAAALLSLSGEVGRSIIDYSCGMLIARVLGSSTYGIFFLGYRLFNLLAFFSYGAGEDGLIRFLGIHIQRKEVGDAKRVIRSSLGLSVGLGVFLGLLTFFSAPLIAERVFHKPDLAIVLRWLSLGLPVFSLMAIAVAALRGLQRITPYVVVRKMFLPLTTLACVCIAIAANSGIGGLAAAYLVAFCCAATLAALLLSSLMSQLREQPFLSARTVRLFSFVGVASIVNVLLSLFRFSDLAIVGAFESSENLGVYVAAKRTAYFLLSLLVAVNIPLVPRISHLASGGQHDQLSSLFKISAQWLLLVSLPMFLIIAFFPREILSLFGPAFSRGHLCLIILAFGCLVGVAMGPTSYLLMMTGHLRWVLLNSIIVTAGSVVLGIVLVARYGILGAAIANGGCMIFGSLAALVEVHALIRLHPYSIRYLKILGAGFLMAFTLALLRRFGASAESALHLFGEVGLGCAVFVFFLLLSGLEQHEKNMLTNLRTKVALCFSRLAGK